MRTILSVYLLLLFLAFISGKAISQENNKLDSLWSVYKKAGHDTTRMVILIDQIGPIYETKGSDSAAWCYMKAVEIADKSLAKDTKNGNIFKKYKAKAMLLYSYTLCNKGEFEKARESTQNAFKIAKEISNEKLIGSCYGCIGLIEMYTGNLDQSIDNFLKAIKSAKITGDKSNVARSYINISLLYKEKGNFMKCEYYAKQALNTYEKLSDWQGVAHCYNIMGQSYELQGEYEKSLNFYLKAMKYAEQANDSIQISDMDNNIGLIYYYQGLIEKSLEYFNKSLEIKLEINDKVGAGNNYVNIGLVYNSMADELIEKRKPDEAKELFKKCLECYHKSISIYKEIGNLSALPACYVNIGNIYAEMNDFNQANINYLEGLKMAEQYQVLDVLATANSNLCYLNVVLADSAALNESQRIQYLNRAVEYGLKAYEIATDMKAKPKASGAAQTLMDAYKKQGNYKKSVEFAEIYIQLQDSMFSDEKTKMVTDMASKYESEKKQFELEKMQKQKELDDATMEAQIAENRKQQILIYSALGGFLIVLVFSVSILEMFKNKRKANIILAKQNLEIQQQKEEISAQRDEIEAQRDLVVLQNEHMEMQKKELTDSITYARRIQSAVLPSGEYAKNILGDHFILYKPKDIVSGDFYWGIKISDWLIITVADCTGHGVPGAFMSMLGVSFLNEIVRKKEITRAGDILDQLREYIIDSMQQRGTRVEQKDGMDMCLCAYNQTTNTLQYAGANNPLYIVKKDSELVMIKPDKQPVAVYEKMSPFTNHLIEVNKGDIIYLASDGFQDQFGGPNNKKFKINRFKDVILSISSKPLNEQANLLENVINEWMAYGEGTEQVDDITILGIKI